MRINNDDNGYKDGCYDNCECDPTNGGKIFVPNVSRAGVYWWRAIRDDNLENSLHLLEFSARNGITDVFISMSGLEEVIGVTAGIVTDGRFAEARMNRHIRPMQEFVRSATEHGIKVYALFGSGGGILFPGASRNTFNRQMFGLKVYNNISNPEEQITGIQFNIEPHQMNWQQLPDETIAARNMRRNYLLQSKADFVFEITDLYKDEFRIDWCMPFWWDGGTYYRFVTDRHGESTMLYRILIQEAAKANGRVLVMSFRDTADRMLNVSRHVVRYAVQHNVPVFLMATINEPTGPQTRFREAGKIEMYYQLNKVRHEVYNSTTDTEVFREFLEKDLLGVAIHHILTWYPLQYERIPPV
ncbi:MAG: hypothetical protein FWE45_03710 [Firmicutes bacterium]|nr:hypothetical protein [Bacillota bacterium]